MGGGEYNKMQENDTITPMTINQHGHGVNKEKVACIGRKCLIKVEGESIPNDRHSVVTDNAVSVHGVVEKNREMQENYAVSSVMT